MRAILKARKFRENMISNGVVFRCSCGTFHSALLNRCPLCGAEDNLCSRKFRRIEVPLSLKAELESIITNRKTLDAKKISTKMLQKMLDKEITFWKKTATTEFNMDEEIVEEIVELMKNDCGYENGKREIQGKT